MFDTAFFLLHVHTKREREKRPLSAYGASVYTFPDAHVYMCMNHIDNNAGNLS